MMRPTIRQIQIFESVARNKSFTRAAEELFITQSTVSIQLKQLSDTLGVQLIEQVGKKLYLTRAGEAQLANCQRLLSTLREMESDAASYHEKPQGILSISGTITSQFFLPRVFGAFSKKYPEVDIVFQVSTRPAIMERFASNQDDLYVIGRIPEGMEIKVIPFVENPFIFIAPIDHPLVGQKKITLRRVLQEPFLTREPGSTTLKELQRYCDENKVGINQKMVLGGNEAIKQGVIGGLGISVLSRFATTLELSLGLIAELDVENFPLQSQWYIGYPSGKKPSTATNAFLDFVRDEGRVIAHNCLYPQLRTVHNVDINPDTVVSID